MKKPSSPIEEEADQRVTAQLALKLTVDRSPRARGDDAAILRSRAERDPADAKTFGVERRVVTSRRIHSHTIVTGRVSPARVQYRSKAPQLAATPAAAGSDAQRE